jgi:endonuclease III
MKVLEDEQICGDLLACLSGTKQQQSHDPARHVDAITQAVAAVRQHGHCAVSHQLMHLLGSSICQPERIACNTQMGAQATKHCCI